MGYSGNGVGSNGVGGNGHANGHTPTGGLGGAVSGNNTRSAMALLKRGVETGHVAETDIGVAVAFARELIADPNAGRREKLRAAEFLELVASRRLTAATDLDKCERLDRGDSTENFAHYSVAIPEARSRITE